MIVVDTNVLAYLAIPGDNLNLAEATLVKDRDWAAPILWRSELRNVLALYVRTGKMPVRSALSAFTDAEAVIAGRNYDVDTMRVLELSLASGRSAYDCEFVYLAERLDVPLVTSDKKVLAAFPGRAISMGAFLKS